MDLGTVMRLANDPKIRPMLQSLLKQFGGAGGGTANLAGLVQRLDKSGLAEQVKTWTGSGQNAPVTGSQISQALGTSTINHVAADTNMTPDQAADGLAGALPRLIDATTHEGQFSDSPDLSNLLGKLAR
jgi:uncharacterized protein YidB (DUF937 family)